MENYGFGHGDYGCDVGVDIVWIWISYRQLWYTRHRRHSKPRAQEPNYTPLIASAAHSPPGQQKCCGNLTSSLYLSSTFSIRLTRFRDTSAIFCIAPGISPSPKMGVSSHPHGAHRYSKNKLFSENNGSFLLQSGEHFAHSFRALSGHVCNIFEAF